MIGPTWSDVASAPAGKIERRDVKRNRQNLWSCPFCNVSVTSGQMARPTGYRCGCGAMFYEQQAVAVHFKERG